MRILVISDIHANLVAFESVLEHAKGDWDLIWFLGDLVGYGPSPNECVELLQQHEHISLSGNHDWAVLDKIDVETFNPEAKAAIRWTQDAINETNLEFLASLPSMRVDGAFTLAHASPRQPVWEYILDGRTAGINFQYFDTMYCLVGHTHVPIIYQEKSDTVILVAPPQYNEPIRLGEKRVIINPGSVGQPRDSDSRAAYAILDLDKMTFEHRRVEYAIAQTQEKMTVAGIPQRLIDRLQYGW